MILRANTFSQPPKGQGLRAHGCSVSGARLIQQI